jgi:hypothetical protein
MEMTHEFELGCLYTKIQQQIEIDIKEMRSKLSTRVYYIGDDMSQRIWKHEYFENAIDAYELLLKHRVYVPFSDLKRIERDKHYDLENGLRFCLDWDDVWSLFR